jgi:hypothetical protein
MIVFDFCPTDYDQLCHWFKSRLDWMPDFASSTKCWFTHWGGNSLSKRNNHAERAIPWEDTLLFYPDHIELVCLPIDPIIEIENQILTHKTAMLVGDFFIDNGILTIDAELSCDPDFCESLWFLLKTHLVDGKESILPEWDPFETNTPGHRNEMSTSQITSYDPDFKAQNVRKLPLTRYYGRRIYKMGITPEIMYSNIACCFRAPRLKPDIPFYPNIWNAVQQHQGPKGTNVMKIYNLKYEV